MQKLVGILLIVLSLAASAQGWASEPGERQLEAKLLHRQLPLSGLTVYSRARHTWQPLRTPTAQVLVVNLWARTCQPCLAELPKLEKLVAEWQSRDPKGVQFLFIADPPDQNAAAEIVSFWSSPYVDQLAGARCPGTPMLRGGRPTCLLTVPDVDPVRSESDTLTRAVTTESRPLTLLVDQRGIVRQVFAGSVSERGAEVSEAIERLLAVSRGHLAPFAK